MPVGAITLTREQFEHRMRHKGELAQANRSPHDPGANGVGVHVTLHFRKHLGTYLATVEKYRDDGGYGEKLSREELSCASLDAALHELAQHGFTVEQLAFY